MVEVRFLGYSARNGSSMGLSPNGLVFGQAVKRLPLSERWVKEGWDQLKGFPWNIRPEERLAPIKHRGEGEIAPRLPSGQLPQPGKSKGFFVLRGDVEKHGSTTGCPGCRNMRRKGATSVAHNAECRARIFKEVEKTDKGRTDSFQRKTEAIFEEALRLEEDKLQQAPSRRSESLKDQSATASEYPPEPMERKRERGEDSRTGKKLRVTWEKQRGEGQYKR